MALESLPQDVRVCVFEHLDSAVSLVNLALTGPKLYAEVQDSQHSSIPRILARKFPRSVLHDAIFTWEAGRRESSSQETIAQFLHRYARKETEPELARLTISDALSIESLCRTVDYFVDSLVRSAMDVASQRYECDTDSVISEAERARTTRALLRFELYRRAFYQSGAHTPSTSEQRMLFWNYFAPWEQEQMACVHDHLCNRMFTGACSQPIHPLRSIND